VNAAVASLLLKKGTPVLARLRVWLNLILCPLMIMLLPKMSPIG
jgi:hypothetical protein